MEKHCGLGLILNPLKTALTIALVLTGLVHSSEDAQSKNIYLNQAPFLNPAYIELVKSKHVNQCVEPASCSYSLNTIIPLHIQAQKDNKHFQTKLYPMGTVEFIFHKKGQELELEKIKIESSKQSKINAYANLNLLEFTNLTSKEGHELKYNAELIYSENGKVQAQESLFYKSTYTPLIDSLKNQVEILIQNDSMQLNYANESPLLNLRSEHINDGIQKRLNFFSQSLAEKGNDKIPFKIANDLNWKGLLKSKLPKNWELHTANAGITHLLSQHQMIQFTERKIPAKLYSKIQDAWLLLHYYPFVMHKDENRAVEALLSSQFLIHNIYSLNPLDSSSVRDRDVNNFIQACDSLKRNLLTKKEIEEEALEEIRELYLKMIPELLTDLTYDYWGEELKVPSPYHLKPLETKKDSLELILEISQNASVLEEKISQRLNDHQFTDYNKPYLHMLLVRDAAEILRISSNNILATDTVAKEHAPFEAFTATVQILRVKDGSIQADEFIDKILAIQENPQSRQSITDAYTYLQKNMKTHFRFLGSESVFGVDKKLDMMLRQAAGELFAEYGRQRLKPLKKKRFFRIQSAVAAINTEKEWVDPFVSRQSHKYDWASYYIDRMKKILDCLDRPYIQYSGFLKIKARYHILDMQCGNCIYRPKLLSFQVWDAFLYYIEAFAKRRHLYFTISPNGELHFKGLLSNEGLHTSVLLQGKHYSPQKLTLKAGVPNYGPFEYLLRFPAGDTIPVEELYYASPNADKKTFISMNLLYTAQKNTLPLYHPTLDSLNQKPSHGSYEQVWFKADTTTKTGAWLYNELKNAPYIFKQGYSSFKVSSIENLHYNPVTQTIHLEFHEDLRYGIDYVSSNSVYWISNPAQVDYFNFKGTAYPTDHIEFNIRYQFDSLGTPSLLAEKLGRETFSVYSNFHWKPQQIGLILVQLDKSDQNFDLSPTYTYPSVPIPEFVSLLQQWLQNQYPDKVELINSLEQAKKNSNIHDALRQVNALFDQHFGKIPKRKYQADPANYFKMIETYNGYIVQFHIGAISGNGKRISIGFGGKRPNLIYGNSDQYKELMFQNKRFYLSEPLFLRN